MSKQKSPEENPNPTEPQVNDGQTPQEPKPFKYVVVRAGFRVSDREYDSAGDEDAIKEWGFWKRVEKNHSYGAPVSIVVYDSKKHRTW